MYYFYLAMIAYLQGSIKKKLAKSIILDTGNIGYLVYLPAPLLEKMVEKEMVELFIYTRVLEDDISLYGFETVSKLEFFKMLLNVNGIGAKTALEILSVDTQKVKNALLTSDITFLTKVPGIGKKTAERLIIELKGKITMEDIDLNRLHNSIEETQISEDAVLALTNLGYQKFEIYRVLKNIPDNLKKVEDIITFFLRNVWSKSHTKTH